jgi:hypothetical protein
MRKNLILLTVMILMTVGVAGTVFACGGDSDGDASTTVSEGTTIAAETTSTIAAETTTTAAEDTTTVSEDTTTTVAEETTTTEAAQTTDTADHAAEFREVFPSNESFGNSTWATLNAAPSSHLGATVDVTGMPSGVTVDPDSRYLTWQLTVTGSDQSATVLCRTNVTLDRTLLSGESTVRVKGIVVGAQAADVGGGPIIYVESVAKAE